MKTKLALLILPLTFTISCISLPKETILLSKEINKGIASVHNAHRKFVELYYSKIENSINTFIEDVYTPYIINFVLKRELKNYEKGQESLYGIIELAGKEKSKKNSQEALKVMKEFQEDANTMIQSKRQEMLSPIIEQKRKIIEAINKSYEDLIYANTTITGYLESARKVKDAQNKAFSAIGIGENKRDGIMKTLIHSAKKIEDALKKAKQIDVESDKAKEEIGKIINQIKK